MTGWIVPALVGLLPVLGFLGVLVAIDSRKLVRLSTVIAVVAAGAVVAGLCYAVNAWLIDRLDFDLRAYSRYVAPIVEELAKAVIVGVLVHTARIGFLVDGAILGFAAGAGFAVVENLYYQYAVPDAGLGNWIVRGFGTAIMHGGATAIYTVATLALIERVTPRVLAFVPGFALAVILHSAFNHMFLSPKLSTLAVIVVIPPLILYVFHRSQQAVGDWLGRGFDSDAERLDLIQSGGLSDSPIGRYLATLKSRFDGPVVADLLCYLRLHTELAMRAKGLLLMRESGFDVPLDEETKAKFEELSYLEKSIGRTGMLALQPVLPMSHKELWQLQMLGK
jgi:RsiW-degrading membrane proteinase PrsW (M82 family)